MAKKRQDGEEVLKDIIAKSTNKVAIAAAQAGLASLQERKAAVSAAIRPVMDIPKIVADPTAAETVIGQPRRKQAISKDDDVTKNIKQIRIDIDKMSKDMKDSKSLLDSIYKSNLKYYESNNELINRLLISNDLLNDRLAGAPGVGRGRGAGGEGAVGAQTGAQEPPSPGSSGPSLLSTIFAAAAGTYAANRFRKAPDVNTPKPGADSPRFKILKRLKDLAGKGGRAALFVGAALAAGLTAEWILSYFEGDNETKARMVDDLYGMTPDWLKPFIDDPELAILMGINAPMLVRDTARAALEAPKTAVQAYKGGRTALRASTAAIKSTAAAASSVKNAYKTYAAARSTLKAVPGGASIAQNIFEQATGKGAKQASEAAKAAKVVITDAKIGEQVAKMGAGRMIRAGLKGVWGVGTGLAGIMAALRTYQGDYTGAALELGSGGLSLIPGAGSAGAVGVDAFILARDLFEHFYGHYPDLINSDEDRRLFNEELLPKVTSYVNDQVSSLVSSGVEVLPIEQTKEMLNNLIQSQPAQDAFSYVPSSDGSADSFSSAIASQTNAGVSVDTSRSITGKSQYLQQNAATPVPVQKMDNQKINGINAPEPAPPNVVIRQGDTINHITSGKTGGAGAPPVSGSPSKIPSPFDRLLYGDTFNWGY